MDRDARLKQFACALFSHVYREYNTTFDLPVKLPHVFTHHAAADCSDEEGKAVLKLCLSMRNVFNGLFVRTFETFQRSTQHFMTFLTSRCLKLCGDDVFLSFLMICAFIAELNLFCLINGCFAFMNTAPKCLQAIFNRRLKKEFYANGGWESLRYFSEHFMQTTIGQAPEEIASEVMSPSLLASIKESLDEDSTDEESDSSSSDDDIGDIEEDEEDCDDIEIDPPPVIELGSLQENSSALGTAPAVSSTDSDDDSSESSDETEMDSNSDDSENDSDEEESDNDMAVAQPNGVKKSDDSDDEESVEEGEITVKSNGQKESADSDDETESSEESDPSSMSEEETESEDSETDVAPTSAQTNCIKSMVQENLHVDKKGSLT